jgi:hypothetical protein
MSAPRRFVLVVAALGCTPKAATPTAKPPPSSQSGDHVVFHPAYVVLRRDAKLFRHPVDDEPLSTSDACSGHEVLMKLEEDRGDWLRVSSGTQGCVESLEGLRDHELFFYVHPDALHRVTNRRVTLRYGDGSVLDIAPGVPVTKHDGLEWVSTDAFSSSAKLPSDALGETYSADDDGPALSPHVSAGWLRWTSASLPYGDGVTLRGVDDLEVFDAKPSEDAAKTLVTLASACLAARVAVPNGAIAAAQSPLSLWPTSTCGSSYGGMGTPPRWFDVDPEATVWFADGSEAGRITRKTRVDARPRDDRVCYALPLTSEGHSTKIELCVDAKLAHELP